jgi:hypothetical protein
MVTTGVCWGTSTPFLCEFDNSAPHLLVKPRRRREHPWWRRPERACWIRWNAGVPAAHLRRGADRAGRLFLPLPRD